MSILTDIKAALEAFKAAEAARDAHQCNDTDRAYDEAFIGLGDILVANAPALVAGIEAAHVLIGVSAEERRVALADALDTALSRIKELEVERDWLAQRWK